MASRPQERSPAISVDQNSQLSLSPAAQAPRADPLGWEEVVSLSSVGHSKRLRVASGETIAVHGLACVGKGDMVRRDASGNVSKRVGDVTLPVTPEFRLELRHVVTPTTTLPLTARELVAELDFDAYHSLAQFHYRTERSFGRRSVLLLECHDPSFPKAVAFIEVTSPFMHLRNRNVLLDAPFAEPGEGVSWSGWDLATRNRYVNVIVRVSRVVVHPELRGLGLSRPLIEAAAAFARERWHVRDLRPLFLEITADMLKFMPFVSSGPMEYIGESEGNADRLAKDMSYLSRAQLSDAAQGHSVLSGRGKGILRRQKRDIEMVTRLRDSMAPGETIPEFIGRLMSSEDVDESAGELLLPLLRHPKPTYMQGLTRASAAFLARRVRELKLTQPETRVPEPAPYSGLIGIDDLSLAYEIDTGTLRSSTSGEVRRAFGLDRAFVFRTGIASLSVKIRPGEVAYLFGASGSGKTSLLRLLQQESGTPGGERVDGSIRLPTGIEIGLLEPPVVGLPLISAIGANTLAEAIYALNAAGLSEPRLYLSDYAQLSAGQQYRASLARLICSNANVWLLDEFAAGLDDATAMAVGRNFARAARRQGVILIAATVRRQPLVGAMSPDIVIQLTQLEPPLITTDWRQWARGTR
jgi:ABC-type transport system involved in cytochrome c biogenesis ATPase subunit/GNAT superfamily N-acetyltransferase